MNHQGLDWRIDVRVSVSQKEFTPLGVGPPQGIIQICKGCTGCFAAPFRGATSVLADHDQVDHQSPEVACRKDENTRGPNPRTRWRKGSEERQGT